MKNFPTLFKIDSKGKTRRWDIKANIIPGTYYVSYGLLDGKLQETTVYVEQKNVGKANETTLEEQAELEAQSLWNKQVDKGYRTGDANKGVLSITGSVGQNMMKEAKFYLPMLAKSFKDYSHKIVYPCYYQPKLDGIRCIASLDTNLNVCLVSRKGKPFNMIPHLHQPLTDILRQHVIKNFALDGELFSKSLDFQTITSIVRKSKTEDPRAAEIEYHIYDCFETYSPNQDVPFSARTEILKKLLTGTSLPLHYVETGEVSDGEEVSYLLKKYETMGYEGIMLRNKHGIYEQDRRSENLQKVKSFMDEEFTIVSGRSGIGKFNGMCIFTCKCAGGEFDVMPMGTEEIRREYWANLHKYIGKKLTVRFFEYTNEGKPRFPVGVNVRDYE